MTAKQKAIVFFGSQITTGGAQRVLLEQAGWFHRKGVPVYVFFYYDKDGYASEWQKKYPFPIQVLSKYDRNRSRLQNIPALIPGFFRLCQALRKIKPHTIETFTHDANIIGIPTAWACGVPVRIASHHGQFAGFPAFLSHAHCAVINSGMTQRIVCVSGGAKQQALREGILDKKISVINNGINPIPHNLEQRAEIRKSLSVSDLDTLILAVGRLVPEKAHTLFIDAAVKIHARQPQTRFFIVGDGPLYNELKNQIEHYQAAEYITLLGNRSDIDALLNAADIFTLYSLTEGMPIALMEAMSAGLPCVAADLPGIAELISDQESGILVQPGNAQRFADAALALLSAPQTAENLATNAQTRALTLFSLEKSCIAYAALFQKV